MLCWIFDMCHDILLSVPLSRHLPPSSPPPPSLKIFLIKSFCFFGLSLFLLLLISTVLVVFLSVRNNFYSYFKFSSVPDVAPSSSAVVSRFLVAYIVFTVSARERAYHRQHIPLLLITTHDDIGDTTKAMSASTAVTRRDIHCHTNGTVMKLKMTVLIICTRYGDSDGVPQQYTRGGTLPLIMAIVRGLNVCDVYCPRGHTVAVDTSRQTYSTDVYRPTYVIVC